MTIDIPEIDAKYEVLEKLGEGGMGAVFKARHRYLEELRVIKTIRPHMRHEPGLQDRFLHEARVAAKLRHPNIAAIHDFAMTEDGTACIVMEHIEGQNLRTFRQSGQQLTVDQVLSVADQTLSALDYLHHRQFVHRDIATDNLMLDWDDQGTPVVTLIDLGLAKSLEAPQQYTKTGTVVGKVRYISPEQLYAGSSGVKVDARCDIYALGVVLYELLTGSYPIVGDDDLALIAGHLHRPPRSFDETDPQARVPAALRQVVLRALEKKPEDRFASAADLSATLRRLRDGEDEPATTMLPTTELEGLEAAPIPPATLGPTTPASDGTATPTSTTGAETMPAARRASTTTEAAGKTVVVGAQTRRWPSRRAWLAVAVFVLVVALGAGAWAARDQIASWVGASSGTSAYGDIFFGDYHALVIGNDRYQRLQQLETAVNDARAIGDVLERRYGFTVHRLENATRQETMDALWSLRQSLTARDNLLIYYAGHGQLLDRSEWWQPVDAEPDQSSNWISTRYDIGTQLAAMSVRHALVVADSCFAGGLGESANATSPDAAATSPEAVRERVQRTSRMVMTSGGLSPVLDAGDARHSVFAKALLDALEKNRRVAATSRIFNDIQAEVVTAARQFGFEQVPSLTAIPRTGDEGGELYFVPSS